MRYKSLQHRETMSKIILILIFISWLLDRSLSVLRFNLLGYICIEIGVFETLLECCVWFLVIFTLFINHVEVVLKIFGLLNTIILFSKLVDNIHALILLRLLVLINFMIILLIIQVFIIVITDTIFVPLKLTVSLIEITSNCLRIHILDRVSLEFVCGWAWVRDVI